MFAILSEEDKKVSYNYLQINIDHNAGDSSEVKEKRPSILLK